MNDNNTIYIVTDDWQRYELNYPSYIWNTPTITWEDMAWISRASRNYVYDYLRDYSPRTNYTTVLTRDFGDIYHPYEEKILSFYYLNCDDA